jgi:tRNA (guanine37-N1)-methyltransferase
MVMLPQTLEATIRKIGLKTKHNHSKIIYMSPQGRILNNQKARELAREPHLVLICGRYGGIDQRIINAYVDEEISIGDYILSGGELAALVLIDSVSRFVPGVLGHCESAENDSFSDGLLEHPHFTRPREFLSQKVPDILLSGNHQLIDHWKSQVSALVTMAKRPDLFWNYIKIENSKYAALKKPKKVSPLEELKKFWIHLSQEDKKTLGLDRLREEDFNV